MLQITATDLPRFMACNGSRLMAPAPRANMDDTVREEGNAADWVISQVFTGQYLREELVDRKAPNGVYITDDMIDHLEVYLSWVVGKGEIERDTSYNFENAAVSGRTDHVFYCAITNTLYVDDFKYGWKIVEPEENWTLVSHAIGWCIQNKIWPQNFVFTIYQPRPYHPKGETRSWAINLEKLSELYHKLHSTLTNPNNQIITGDHCYKCPAMATCPAAQMCGMNSIEISLQPYNSDPDPDDLEFLIEQSKRAMEVLKRNHDAYTELALHKLKNGAIFKNYTIQQDFSKDVWKDDVTPELVQMITGEDWSKKQLKSPSQLRKDGVPDSVIAGFTEKRSKGVKLVKATANEIASKVFNK